MIALVKALQVILALSVLIFIHELGHFAWARIFRIKVEKFYLFFDIGGHRIASWKWGETEFGIGWLPLGGYCKIAGMVDESMDMEQLKGEPKPWEFRTHPAWQRLFVMAGGVLNNFIFAIVAYCLILGIWGQSYIPNRGTQIYTNELGYEMGFRSGDEIIDFDGYEPGNFGMLQADLVRRNVREARVLRGRDTVKIVIDQSYFGEVMNSAGFFDLAIPFVIDSVMETSPNTQLMKGDRLVSVEGTPVEFLQDASPVLAGCSGGFAEAGIIRGADTLATTLQVDSLGKIGVYAKAPAVETREYDFLESIPAGMKLTFSTIADYLSDLRLLATPSTGAYKSVGSFIAIGQVMPASWDWFRFINILALLSIMLAVMNLIPIPGLDGGHILFTLVEMITGKKPGDRFLYIAQLIGMALLIGLMLLAFGNDIGRLIH
ncbi:MAG: RIP metalloprotease RseP [Bacteroidales bacterium]|nr:RIP metalloprotease RseP [Bacteroidales bacterium]